MGVESVLVFLQKKEMKEKEVFEYFIEYFIVWIFKLGQYFGS